MKHYYSVSRTTNRFEVFGETILIEYRPKLKVFDLVYYPMAYYRQDRSKYFEKLVVRDADFLNLASIIAKLDDEDVRSMNHQKLVKTICMLSVNMNVVNPKRKTEEKEQQCGTQQHMDIS